MSLARHALGFAAASAAPVGVLWGVASLFTVHPMQSFSDFPIEGGFLLLIAGVWALVTGIPFAAILIRNRRTSAWYFALAGFFGGALPSAVALIFGEQFPPFDGTARSWLHVAFSSSMFGGLGLVGGVAYWVVAIRGRVLKIDSSESPVGMP
jgi:hypothetical protein